MPLAVTEDAGHRDFGVVIQDRLRYAAKECERPNVAVAERFRRLRRIRHHKTAVRVRQVKCQEVDLALHPADDPDRFTEVRLGMPGRMHQRHEHFLRSLPTKRDVILHDRDTARKAVLVPQPLE